jgi:hypothetical protein
VTDAAGPVAGWKRLRPSRALGIFVALVLVTLLASRTCADTSEFLTKEEAVAIAQREIEYAPDGNNIRFLRRGVDQHPYWAVSLWVLGSDGVTKTRTTVVVVDARGGRVVQVDPVLLSP